MMGKNMYIVATGKDIHEAPSQAEHTHRPILSVLKSSTEIGQLT